MSGEISALKIYEDDLTLAFMDIAKDVDGHILAISKKHWNNNRLDKASRYLCGNASDR